MTSRRRDPRPRPPRLAARFRARALARSRPRAGARLRASLAASALLTALALLCGPLATGGLAASSRARAHATRCRTDARAPFLVAPCAGARIPRRRTVTFTARDPDGSAHGQPPYLDIDPSRTLTDGHLAPDSDGNGVFDQMNAVRGRPGLWRLRVAREPFASWWDNRPGTVWVQVEQADPRAPSGISYGPITELRVG